MKKELIAAMLASSSVLSSHAQPHVDIVDNPGGYIDEFAARRHAYEKAGVQVRFNGYCASACVIFSGMKNTCVMDGAVFAFHQGYEPPSYSRGWATNYMLRNMNVNFRHAIEESGEELPAFDSGEFLYLFAEDIIAHGWMKRC